MPMMAGGYSVNGDGVTVGVGVGDGSVRVADGVGEKEVEVEGVHEIPDRGGDTLFSSAYAVWDELPQRLKARLEGRMGTFKYGGRKRLNALLNEEDRHEQPVRHPLVQVHPETGRTLLYFDQGKILAIEGYSAEESVSIIAEMEAYMVSPPCQYRHQWRKGDVVIWDNRCSYHKAAGDYPPEQDRIHWRVSIKSH